MKKIYILLPLLCATAFCTGAAEDLTKEITVEKDFVPTEQKATKTGALPLVMKTTVPKKTLTFSDWATAVDVPLQIPVLAPYGYKTEYEFSKKRGYFDLGAGSHANVVGSAGFHFVDNEKMSLKGWLQHTSTWNGKNMTRAFDDATLERLKQKFNDNVVGLDFSNRLWKGTLNLGAFYHFDHFNYYGGVDKKWKESRNEQTVNEFNLRAGWTGARQAEGLNYSVGLTYNHFGYSHSLQPDLKGINENLFKLSVNAETYMGSNAHFGVNIIGNYVYYTNPTQPDYSVAGTVTSLGGNKGLGIITMNPYVRYREGRTNMVLGLNADISLNDGTIVRFSPNAKVDYNLLDGFTVYAGAQGGKRLSLLSDMNALNRYTDPSSIMGSVYSPVDGELGFRVGPFQGFTAKIFGGFGVFNNQQLPWLPVSLTDADGKLYDYMFSSTLMRGVDMKGWRAGLELGYQYKNFADFTAGFQYSPQDEKKGYAFGLDRPKYVIDAKLKVRPIEKLTVTINYQLRGKRSYWSHYVFDTQTPVLTSWSEQKLDDVNLLNVGASYQINSTFGVFAEAANLLNKQWDANYGMSAQKFNALGGISILF